MGTFLSPEDKQLSVRSSEEGKQSAQVAPAFPIDETAFRLAPEQWEAFCERLDAPAQTIPALRWLFDGPEP